MKEEIIAGLKNALQRGQNLEQAAQSFINAGYSPQEVQEAKNFLIGGPASMPQPPMKNAVNAAMPQSQNSFPVMPAQQSSGFNNAPIAPAEEQLMPNKLPSIKPAKKSDGGRTALIVIVILLLLIFVGALSYLVYYLAT
jgi:hypothetical protein